MSLKSEAAELHFRNRIRTVGGLVVPDSICCFCNFDGRACLAWRAFSRPAAHPFFALTGLTWEAIASFFYALAGLTWEAFSSFLAAMTWEAIARLFSALAHLTRTIFFMCGYPIARSFSAIDLPPFVAIRFCI